MPLNIERHMDDVIVARGMVKFDRTIYNHYDASFGGGVGYSIIDQCVIHVHKPGDYVLKWDTVQMTGLSSDGDYFCLKKRVEISGIPTTYEWVSLNDEQSVAAADSRAEAITLYEEDMVYKEWTGVPAEDHFDDDGNPVDVNGKKIALREDDGIGIKYFLLDENENKIAVPLLDEWGNPVLDESGDEIPIALLTVALFNVTDINVKLSPHNHIKASMMVFNIPPLAREGVEEAQMVVDICDDMDYYEENSAIVDLDPWLAQLQAMEAWQDGEIERLSILATNFEQEYMDYFHPAIYNKDESSHFPGMWVCYNQSGKTFNFWAAGRATGSPFPAVDGKLMLISSSVCTPLKLYVGDPCVSPCYCTTVNGDFWLSIFFDNTGIYLLGSEEELLQDLVTLRFTRALILS